MSNISLPTSVLYQIGVVLHVVRTDGPEIIAYQERLLEYEGLLVIVFGRSTCDIETIDVLVVLSWTFLPTTDIPETLALESELVHTLLMDDGAHTGLGIVVTGVGAVVIPSGLDIWNLGTLAHSIEIIIELATVGTVRTFKLVDCLGIEQIKVSKTHDRIREPSGRDIGSTIGCIDTVLVGEGLLGEVTCHRTYVGTCLSGILSYAALNLLHLVRGQVIVLSIGKLAEPLAAVEAQEGIETRLAVEVELHGLIATLEVELVLLVATLDFHFIPTCLTILVNSDWYTMLRIELFSHLQWHTEATITGNSTSKLWVLLVLKVDTTHNLPVYALFSPGLGVTPDELRVPLLAHSAAENEVGLQRIVHTIEDILALIELEVNLLALVDGSLTSVNGILPTLEFLLFGLGGEELHTTLVDKVLLVVVAVEERAGGVAGYTSLESITNRLGDATILGIRE